MNLALGCSRAQARASCANSTWGWALSSYLMGADGGSGPYGAQGAWRRVTTVRAVLSFMHRRGTSVLGSAQV